jgi:penicillin-binding protein 1A
MGRPKNSIKSLSWPKAFFTAAGIYFILGLIAYLILLFYSNDLPSIEQLQKVDPEMVTRIFSSDGVILQELYTQRRIYVPIEKIPQSMVNAVIAIEDSRFLKHWGVSMRDFSRAMIIDILTLSKRKAPAP